MKDVSNVFVCDSILSLRLNRTPPITFFKSDKTSSALQLWPPGALNDCLHVACELVEAAAAAGGERGGQGGERKEAAGELCAHPGPVIRGHGSSREGRVMRSQCDV